MILQITADALDDLEGARIANENRVRSLAQVKDMGDSPEADRMAGIVEGIRDLEHRAELELKRALRKHPLGPWVKATKGLGEKQAGRLLAAIGDPYVRPAFFDENGEEVAPSRPRTVSELWAYCGYHVVRSGHRRHDTHATTAGADSSQGGDAGQGGCEDQQCTAGVAPLRTRGAKANWNKWAKMRAYLVAESCLKQLAKTCVKPDGQAWADHDPERCACSPYRVVYDEGRRKYADAVHQVPCKRCGPSGRPAEVGRPLSDGHKHARALRLVAKTVLKDLWLAARDIHEGKAQGREAA